MALRSDDAVVRLGFAAALLVGVIVRVLPVVSSPLPVGDGGLIMSMIDDIRGAGLLPPATSYNGLEIPFLYPPLALMATALFGEVTGVSTLTLLRFMPLVAAIACLLAFAALALAVLPQWAATGAVLSYAVMPHAFDWVVAGGGLTRGTGLLLALLAMWVAVRSPMTLRSAVIAGSLLGVSALAHPQTPFLGAMGCAVLTYPGGHGVGNWGRWLFRAAIMTLLISLVWLVPATLATGIFPIGAAGHRLEPGGGLIRMASLAFSGAAFMDLVTPLAVAGLIISILGRALRLPIFLVLVYLVGPGGGDFLGVVAWSLLAGVGLSSIVEAGIRVGWGDRLPSVRVGALVMGCLFFAVLSAAGSTIHQQSKLHAVSADQSAAMRWVAEETDPETQFLVATVDTWGNDEVSEWFPALAERGSLGTVQGSEWLGSYGFDRQERIHLRLVGCMHSSADCYRGIAERADAPGAYLFIPKGQLQGPLSAGDCCPAARDSLQAAGYEVIYDGSGATIGRPIE
ncbi:MAG: hypothetical protein M3153_00535 [Chloroflexota bacterium]|nr:hypothetical protein [Chloroflexota bacterium]